MTAVAVVLVIALDDLEACAGRVLLVLPEAEAELMVEAHTTVMRRWAAKQAAAAKPGRAH
jgi:hypothetical protein